MPPEITHLSYSSISSYLLCGRAYRFHYIDQVETLTAPALVFGSAFHNMAERYIANGGELTSLWQEAWGAQQGNDSRIDWGIESAEGLADTGQRIARSKAVVELLDSLRAQYRADDPRCALEKRVELHVPGVPVPIIGYIDIITADGVPGDFKTAARMWSDGKADSELQPLFYLAALNQAGVEVPDWTFRHYVVSKTSRPDAKVFEVQHRPAEAFWLFEMIAEVWRGIEAGVFVPTPGTWKCNPRYCEYYALCRGKYG
jgi:CRISPR/Cas system-associated exonuclease Cas4 (RecB family)